MDTYGIRDLQRRSSRIVERVRRTRRPALVTRHGKPVAVLSALDEDGLEDFILANAPEFVAGMSEADKDVRAGRTRSLDAVVRALPGKRP